jgi:putative CocE/NonD family hydrolase
MVVASEFPHGVRVVENLWIPLAEGIRLAAKLWLPETTNRTPVPAVLEYIPYRKGDATAQRDAMLHPYFAGHGYAAIRVDMRGSGDSDGILTDEYLKLEQDDALEVISWIARQPWCTGAVGMIGNSWGGFNALQVAARRPPELKAIITSCSTDDRYADDIHYMGGCLLSDNLRWATIMLANNSRPPDPAVVGERWREMWLARLRDSGFWMKPWIEHQRRDAYWKHGSVCEDFASIQCPVFALGGWSDGYSNAVPRLMAGLKVPRKAWIGQWSHNYPHLANPGPKAGFLQEAVRWWDKWLKGMDNGALDGPMLRVWMQDSVPPATRYATLPGRWVAEPDWPPPGVQQRRYALNGNRLQAAAGDAAGDNVPLCIKSPQTVGWNGGRWYSQVIVPDLPGDQREDDGNSLVFDTDPLAERLEILGAPVVELELASDRTQGLVAVRLSNVASDGATTRVSYGLLNLSHRGPRASKAARAGTPVPCQNPAQRLRPELPGRTPYPARHLYSLLADRVAIPGAGHPHPLRRSEHAGATGASAVAGGCRVRTGAAGRDPAAARGRNASTGFDQGHRASRSRDRRVGLRILPRRRQAPFRTERAGHGIAHDRELLDPSG